MVVDYGEGIKENVTGRRVFRFVNVSLPKGSAKTELMSLIALTELHPDAPIRFNGYDPNAEGGLAPGRSVVSPFIPILAPTKDQLDDLEYGAAMVIASDADPDGQVFDVNKERIMVVGESESKILPVAASGGRLDGLKPTHQSIDESHHLFEDRHRKAYRAMVNNLPKRKEDDAWQMTCTTAGDPSEPLSLETSTDLACKWQKVSLRSRTRSSITEAPLTRTQSSTPWHRGLEL